MKKRFNNKYNRYIYEIFAGEYFVTQKKKIILQTLLGSCIAVCMIDKVTRIIGINHFMLPGNPNPDKIVADEDSRYGIHAMELMINAMMKKGAIRQNLQAKVFGGGKVIQNGLNHVSENNVKFILAYLNMEKIPILARDLGGEHGRKILVIPDTFTVYQKKIEISKLGDKTIKREKRLMDDAKDKKDTDSNLTLFV